MSWANIRRCDLQFENLHVKVLIPKSKTDQLRHGSEVLIARTGISTCPVAMLEKYISRAHIQLDSHLCLFRPIVNGKVERLRDSGGLTYSRLRELFKQKLEPTGLYQSLVYTVCGLGEPPQQLKLEFQIGFLNGMVAGVTKRRKCTTNATSKKLHTYTYTFPQS